MEKTTDYDCFKRLGGNAPINMAHLNRLTDAIQKNNLLEARPILINEKMEVIDGQHRLEAAKRLGVPIFYIKIQGSGVDDIAMLNSNQRNWKMEHYLHLYCDYLNNENYKRFRSWLKENNLCFTQGISFFIEESSISQCRKSFKDGEFIFDEKYKEIAENYTILLSKIVSTQRGIKRPWIQQSFVRAFIAFCNNKEIEIRRFWEQFEKYPFIISVRASKQDYLELFYELYNYRKHIKVAI